MECTEVRELLLPRELGRLSEYEASELDEHAASCTTCRALVDAAGRTYRMLSAWRVATDLRVGKDALDGVVASLAAEREARADSRRRARPAPAGTSKAKVILLLLVGAALLGGAVALSVMTRTSPGLPEPDPMPPIIDGVVDAASARDAACVLDLMLFRELSFDAPRERRIAELSWARALARREGVAAAPELVREIARGRAEPGSPRPPGGGGGGAGGDPLRLVGELELAGRTERARAELEALLAGGPAGEPDSTLARRARLHLAAAFLRQGKLDEAEAVVDILIPPAPSGRPGAEPGAPAASDADPPADFIGRLAEVIGREVAGARAARASLAEWKRPRPGEADDKGGKKALDGYDFDLAFESFAGFDPSCLSQVIAGWAHLLRGETDEARAALSEAWKKGGSRSVRSLGHLGLSELAFREGRYATGLGRLGTAMSEAPSPETATSFRTSMKLARGTRRLVDVGSAPGAESDLELAPDSLPLVPPGLAGLVESKLMPRIGPLVEARDAVTKGWPRRRSAFDRQLGAPPPGTVSARDALPKIDFESGTAPLEAARGSTVSEADGVPDASGVPGRGARASSAGRAALAEIALEGVPEVETWIACAVKLDTEGAFVLHATDAESGTRFLWRTFVLKPGRWHRLAVPLGAFEPERPTGRDESLLTRKVSRLGFSLTIFTTGGAGASAPAAAFALDDVLLHHGRPPKGADQVER